jgi:hypothetical protein
MRPVAAPKFECRRENDGKGRKQIVSTVFQLSLKNMRLLNRLIPGAATGFLTLTPMVVLAESPNSIMKAIVVREYGGPEALKLEDVPRPVPKDDEILVKVIAAGVNPVDASMRSGKYAKFFGTKLDPTSLALSRKRERRS